jgi:hypothetical protein
MKNVKVLAEIINQIPVEDLDYPLHLKNWAKKTKAFSIWSPEYFKEKFGDVSVPLSHYKTDPYQAHLKKPLVNLSEYIDFITGKTKGTEVLTSDSYMAGWHYLHNAPEIEQDFEVPVAFKDNLLDQFNREVINYDSKSIFIGHSGVNSPLHTDSFGVSVWLANIYGTKIVRIVDPVDYKIVKNGMDVFDPENLELLQKNNIDVMEVTLEAGDILFIPPGFWHQVINLDVTIAISVNFLSAYHFAPFEQQMRAKLMRPYMKLINFKKKIIGGVSDQYFSQKSASTFNFVENETKFISFLEGCIAADKVLVNSLSEKVE